MTNACWVTYHVFSVPSTAPASPIAALFRSCRYMALLILRLGPTPIRAMNFPAFRSLHHSDVLPDEKIKLIITLINRTPNKILLAFKVFDDHRTKLMARISKDDMQLPIMEAKDPSRRPVKVQFRIVRRGCDIKGKALPENSETRVKVCCPTKPNIWTAFLVRL